MSGHFFSRGERVYYRYMAVLNPDDYIITRKRKKYRFALFANNPLCFEIEEWNGLPQPDVLEIGAGTALFSVGLGETDPGRQYLAVDVKADRLQTGARRAAELGMANVHFLRARADQLETAIKAHSLQDIWITFPDPFPKDRSAKHRLTHSNFLQLYERLLHPMGTLQFKTDAAELFTWSLEQLVERGWHIYELSFDLHASQLDDQYKLMTTYETRFTAQGLPTYFVRAAPPVR